MRKKVIAGNWKMNMLPNETINFIEGLSQEIKNVKNEIILCVPYTDLFYALLTAQNTNIKIGAQNMHWKEKGAYTGEISGQMLKSIGVEYVIIGHSERRQYFAETDETVNLKVKSALENNLKPIICVGETLEQREHGETEKIIESQIKLALKDLTKEQFKLAPPTKAPSISDILNNSSAFEAFTLPPYCIIIFSAISSLYNSFICFLIYFITLFASSGVAVFPVPIAHTGSR